MASPLALEQEETPFASVTRETQNWDSDNPRTLAGRHIFTCRCLDTWMGADSRTDKPEAIGPQGAEG